MISFFYSYVSFLISTFFFFNDTATTEIYTLSLHDALPIYRPNPPGSTSFHRDERLRERARPYERTDRKSTRLNSSHQIISYAVFCLKKKKKNDNSTSIQDAIPITQHTLLRRMYYSHHTRCA